MNKHVLSGLRVLRDATLRAWRSHQEQTVTRRRGRSGEEEITGLLGLTHAMANPAPSYQMFTEFLCSPGCPDQIDGARFEDQLWPTWKEPTWIDATNAPLSPQTVMARKHKLHPRPQTSRFNSERLRFPPAPLETNSTIVYRRLPSTPSALRLSLKRRLASEPPEKRAHARKSRESRGAGCGEGHKDGTDAE